MGIIHHVLPQSETNISELQHIQCYPVKFTIYFLQRNLAKNVQVGAVQCPAEHPVNPGVIGVEQSLGGNTIRNHPNTQEKQEEEHVLHL